MAGNLGTRPTSLAVALDCDDGQRLEPGTQVEAAVTVDMPAGELPGLGAVGAWSWTVRHREPVDRYVAAR
jgi:hypothetical protein